MRLAIESVTENTFLVEVTECLFKEDNWSNQMNVKHLFSFKGFSIHWLKPKLKLWVTKGQGQADLQKQQCLTQNWPRGIKGKREILAFHTANIKAKWLL